MMKIYHRFMIGETESRRELLTSLGIEFESSDTPLVRLLFFSVAEQDPVWDQVRDVVTTWNLEDGNKPDDLGFVSTSFSLKELAAASYFELSAGQKGYPQPEDDFGYLAETYDLSGYCSDCGTGARQVAPFRIKGEPKWGSRKIMQLNWVFDEFFVLPDVWEKIFHPAGINCSAVLNHRTGEPLNTVVQLRIDKFAPSPLRTNGLAYEICGKCDRRKYLPIQRGYFPAFETAPGVRMCKTRENFGSGASSRNEVIVDRALYAAMKEARIAGAAFYPLQECPARA